MTDVFISYRRGDWAAARGLYEALQHDFNVFLNVERRSINLGRRFPDAIVSALAECKVLLSVIGPEWRDPSNLKRLHDPEDWVRYEIETALYRQDRTRVLPLLMGTPMPAVADLPAQIGPLALLRALPLNNEDWQRGIADLTNTLKEWLGRASIREENEGVSVLERLAALCQLCNRSAQVSSLARILVPGSAPVVVLLGHKEEQHIEFIESLPYRKGLRSRLKLDECKTGLQIYPLQWSPAEIDQGGHSDALLAQIGGYLLNDSGATSALVRSSLLTSAQPLLMWMEFDYPRFKRCGPAAIEGFVKAWTDLIGAPAPEHAIHAVQCPVMLWLLIAFENEAQRRKIKQSLERLVAHMPELNSLDSSDVTAWIKLEEVGPVIRGRAESIEALVKDRRYTLPNRTLRMRSFVRGVLDVFAA